MLGTGEARGHSVAFMPVDPLLIEPVTDPLPLYRLSDAGVSADLVAVAIAHFDFFTWLEAHPATLGAICAHFEIRPRPADVLMTLLTALGLVQLTGGIFLCTARAREHLVAGSPWSQTAYFRAMKDRPQIRELLEVLRTGKPVRPVTEEDGAKLLTAAMDCRGVVLGPALAQKLDLADSQALLDVAGGSGIYACALAARHPHLRAAVLEKPPVDALAREAIAARGYADKVSVSAGDMLAEAWPAGFDVHLLSNVLHEWDEPDVRQLLAKSHAALSRGGQLIIHGVHLNAEKSGPLLAAEYSALVMSQTVGKCYSLREMQNYVADAGFDWVDFQPTTAGRSFVLARRL